MSTEVAVRSSTDKRKPNVERGTWYGAFLAEYAQTGHVAQSAAAAGVSRHAVYKARERDEEFARAYEIARKHVADELEATAVARAKKHSDTLLIFLLKGLKPDVYGDKLKNEMSGPGGKPIAIKLVYDE